MKLEKEEMETELSTAHGELEAAKVQSDMWRSESFRIRGLIDASVDELNEMKVKMIDMEEKHREELKN